MDRRILAGAAVLLRSRSLSFTREYLKRDGEGALRTYDWDGTPVSYRSGTSDIALIYNILVRRQAEYAMPAEAGLEPGAVRTVLDIGANIGVAALYFARLFPNATVHCFEPEPRNGELLERNARTCDRIRVHRFALGAEDGSLKLYDSDDAANLGGFSGHTLGINPARSQSVPLRHAGRALAALGVTQADVVKIDTEGAECEILTAFEPAMLARVRVIVGELHGHRDAELLDYLQPLFRVGQRRRLRTRLLHFHAVNRQPG